MLQRWAVLGVGGWRGDCSNDEVPVGNKLSYRLLGLQQFFESHEDGASFI
jgi:hypothetical protein